MTTPTRPRTVLVTGSSRGIGLAVCVELTRRGFHVIAAARRRADAEAAARTVGGGTRPAELDVTDEASIGRCYADVGPVDALVNNAGVLLDNGDRASNVALDTVARTLDVNLFGAWRVAQTFLPPMVRRGWGRVVMVSSGTGVLRNGLATHLPAYSLSKAALNALTLLLAEEARDTGVLVNAVNPGMVRTAMMPKAERDPAEAAVDITDAVLLPDGGPTGKLLRRGQVVDW